MFDMNHILYNPDMKQFTCKCQCRTKSDAEYLCAKYRKDVCSLDTAVEIYFRRNVAIIGGYDKRVVEYAARMINRIEFNPPLDVTIFWGHHCKGLDPRWCIGFDVANAGNFVELINSYGPMFCADKHPCNWHDKNKDTYSVVMLTKNLDYKIECTNGNDPFKQYLECISNVTDRICNVSIIE